MWFPSQFSPPPTLSFTSLWLTQHSFDELEGRTAFKHRPAPFILFCKIKKSSFVDANVNVVFTLTSLFCCDIARILNQIYTRWDLPIFSSRDKRKEKRTCSTVLTKEASILINKVSKKFTCAPGKGNISSLRIPFPQRIRRKRGAWESMLVSVERVKILKFISCKLNESVWAKNQRVFSERTGVLPPHSRDTDLNLQRKARIAEGLWHQMTTWSVVKYKCNYFYCFWLLSDVLYQKCVLL